MNKIKNFSKLALNKIKNFSKLRFETLKQNKKKIKIVMLVVVVAALLFPVARYEWIIQFGADKASTKIYNRLVKMDFDYDAYDVDLDGRSSISSDDGYLEKAVKRTIGYIPDEVYNMLVATNSHITIVKSEDGYIDNYLNEHFYKDYSDSIKEADTELANSISDLTDGEYKYGSEGMTLTYKFFDNNDLEFNPTYKYEIIVSGNSVGNVRNLILHEIGHVYNNMYHMTEDETIIADYEAYCKEAEDDYNDLMERYEAGEITNLNNSTYKKYYKIKSGYYDIEEYFADKMKKLLQGRYEATDKYWSGYLENSTIAYLDSLDIQSTCTHRTWDEETGGYIVTYYDYNGNRYERMQGNILIRMLKQRLNRINIDLTL
jgi:hypothetical protein